MQHLDAFANVVAGEVHPPPHILLFDNSKKSDFH